MSERPTVTHCDACARLTDRWHRFAELYAASGDKESAFYEAGFTAVNWRQRVSDGLTKLDVRASVDHHRQAFSEKAVDLWEEIRARHAATATVNLFDLVVPQGEDSDAHAKLKQYFTQGVEQRKADGSMGYREPTAKEWRRAKDAAASLRMLRPEELPRELQMVITEFHEDIGRGILKYKIDVQASSKFLAELDGKVAQKITVVQAESVAERKLEQLMEALPAALSALASGTAQEWCRERFSEIASRARARGDEAAAVAAERMAAEATGEAWEVEAGVWG